MSTGACVYLSCRSRELLFLLGSERGKESASKIVIL